MKYKLLSVLLFLALLASVLTPATGVQARAAESSISAQGISPAGMLNPDGTLRLDGTFHGALNLSGYSVRIDPRHGPVFGPAQSGEDAPAAVVTPGQWGTVGGGSGAIKGIVRAVAVIGTDVYIGGEFINAANIAAADHVAKWDGTQWSPLGTPANGDGAIPSGYVYALAVYGTDLYVGGSFNYVYDGATYLPTTSRIAKWDGTHWSGLGHNGANGSSINNVVNAIAVDGSGNVYVGGYFTDVNNKGSIIPEADYIAKWDGANWSALGSNGASNGSLNSSVSSIVINGTDVYVGGWFTNVNDAGSSLTAADYIAKWNGTNWSALGNNGAGNNGSLGNLVTDMAFIGTDLYVGGYFQNVNDGGTSLPAADYIARWDGTHWNALSSNGSSNGSLGNVVTSLAVIGSDLYVGGCFGNVSDGGGSLNAADTLARWDGSHWYAVGSGNAGDGALASDNCNSTIAWTLGVNGSHLIVGGNFYDANNNGTVLPGADMVAQWDGANWSSLGSDPNGSLNSRVGAILVHGTDIYVGGSFTDVSDQGYNLKAADYVAKWDGANWSALGSNGAGDGSLNAPVYALAMDDSGNLYVGGTFTNVNNNGTTIPEADYIAKWDGSNWSALGSNGNGNGAISSSSAVLTMAWSGTELYVGGNFTDISNNGTPIPEADYIATWNGTTWSAVGSNGANNGSLNATVRVIAINGSNVYMGGWFTDVNDGGTLLTSADYIVKWDGSHWSALGDDGGTGGSIYDQPGNNYVMAIAVSGSDVYVGGSFANLNNHGNILNAADNIAKWDGTNWSALGNNGAGNGVIANGDVRAIAVDGNGNIYVGGPFLYLSGLGWEAAYAARWDGSNWSSLGNDGNGKGSLNSWVWALAVNGEELLVGGEFENVNNSGTPLLTADDFAVYGIGTDSTPPTVSITRLDPDPTNAAVVHFNVLFSEDVTGVAPSDFAIIPTGLSDTSLHSFSGSGVSYIIGVNTGTGNGMVRLDVLAPGNITDLAGNPLGGLPYSSESYIVSKTATVLIAPASGVTLTYNRPTFDWSDLPTVKGYQIQVSKSANFSTFVINTQVTGAANSQFTPNKDLPAKSLLYWRVRGKLSSTKYTPWSTVQTFTTANPPSVPSLITPAAGASLASTTPLFDWQDSKLLAGAVFDHYQLQVATDVAFTSIVHDVDLAGQTNSQDNSAVLNVGTTYYWRVRAFAVNGDTSSWSVVRNFKVKFPAPTLLTPADLSVALSVKPTFTWNAVLGAPGYTIQISKTKTFGTGTLTAKAVAPTYTPGSNLSAHTTYYWRVRVTGTYASGWSAIFSFTTP